MQKSVSVTILTTHYFTDHIVCLQSLNQERTVNGGIVPLSPKCGKHSRHLCPANAFYLKFILFMKIGLWKQILFKTGETIK